MMGRSLQPPARSFLDIQLANGHAQHLPSPTSTSISTTTTTSHSHTPSSSLSPPSQIPPLRLTPREDSTRIQLQRQRLKEQHVKALVSKTTTAIPGLKTSAAFFASLRTNLRLHASPPPSPMSTPPSMRGSATSLPPPSPLSGPVDSVMEDSNVSSADDPLADVPELKSYVTESEDEKIAALKLVADSIAQMRQTANRALIFHPLNLALLVALLALLARYMLDTGYDMLLVGTTCVGVIMASFAGYRYLTMDYLFAAEALEWGWLGDADVIVTKFGVEVIGTVIIDWVSGESSRQKRKRAWRGEIKAWTVRLKYRKKGVGAALLEEAVKEAKKKGAEVIEFAEDHANAKRTLPSLYNSVFDTRDRNARELLQDQFESSPVRGKRK